MTYVISEERLRDLLRQAKILSNLRSAGVDDWDEYDYAMEMDYKVTEEELSHYKENNYE